MLSVIMIAGIQKNLFCFLSLSSQETKITILIILNLLGQEKNFPARIALGELLEELSKNTWQELTQRSKYQKGGFEKIPYSSCKESIFNKFKITPDTSIYSFRFGKGDAYRLLGIKPTSCHKLNILGYDFDYSAYDHGS